jgi:hypothetical protein
MCMLVKFRGQFVSIFARIEVPSNRALKEQIKEKQTCLHLQLKLKLEIYKTISGTAPKHFSEVYLTNELICVHSHH